MSPSDVQKKIDENIIQIAAVSVLTEEQVRNVLKEYTTDTPGAWLGHTNYVLELVEEGSEVDPTNYLYPLLKRLEAKDDQCP